MQSASLCGLVSALVLAPGAAVAGRPGRLVDRSTAPPVPRVLRSLASPLATTKARVARVEDVRAALVACPEARQAHGSDPAVVRIGVRTRSVTFRVGLRHVVACDRDPGAHAVSGPWCGIAAWDLSAGGVSDPRLSLCYGRRGSAAAGFAWIDPAARAKWIVVDQPGYREVYPTGGGLPVRVATVSGLARPGTALFHVAEYDARGDLLVRKEVVAEIAG